MSNIIYTFVAYSRDEPTRSKTETTMNNEKKIPAQLDYKDLIPDLVFESIFDDGDYNEVVSGQGAIGAVLGAIDQKPYMLRWKYCTNMILLFDLDDIIANGNQHQSEHVVNAIKKRVEQINEELAANEIYAEIINNGSLINGIEFYFKPTKIW